MSGDTGKVKVSIIMLTYNRPQYVDRAIRSVIDQNFAGWELIIVDDGVCSQTEKMITAWQSAEGRIRYFHRTKGGNIANATNFGLRQARGEYIAILDDDDFWIAANKLSKQVAFLDLYPDCVACGGGAIVTDQDGRERLRYFKAEDDKRLRRWALLANPILHSTSMYRRTRIFECGLYDETLPGFQDWDVFLKLGQAGTFSNIREALVSYTIWGGGGSFQGHRANTGAAVRIVMRHGRRYRNFLAALALASLNYVYARFPLPVKRLSFASLSRVKKMVFASRATSPKLVR